MCRSISFRLCLLTLVVCVSPGFRVDGKSVAMGDSPVFETVHTSNAALFNRLGLSPLRISQGHHKKRLAGPEPPLNFAMPNHQSYGRRHGHKDSHVYIVKLPPSLPYYAITRPHKELLAKGIKSSGNFPVGFQSNGKPASIYHWNLPVMKKISDKKRILEQRMQMASKKQKEAEVHSNEIANIENSESRVVNEQKEEPIGQKLHFRNNDKRLNYRVEESGFNRVDNDKNKNYRLDDSMMFKIKSPQNNEHRFIWNGINDPHNTMYQNSMKQKKHRKKSAMSYYAPFSTKSESTNLHKNFSGNGKPKAFYVIEKSRKPVYYHPLLP